MDVGPPKPGYRVTRRRLSFVKTVTYDKSSIEDWDTIGLDRNAGGGEYKPGSLYIEAVR